MAAQVKSRRSPGEAQEKLECLEKPGEDLAPGAGRKELAGAQAGARRIGSPAAVQPQSRHSPEAA